MVSGPGKNSGPGTGWRMQHMDQNLSLPDDEKVCVRTEPKLILDRTLGIDADKSEARRWRTGGQLKR